MDILKVVMHVIRRLIIRGSSDGAMSGSKFESNTWYFCTIGNTFFLKKVVASFGSRPCISAFSITSKQHQNKSCQSQFFLFEAFY